jgi:hypothetical protein
MGILDVEPKIAVLAFEDLEADPDRWWSYSEYGQELWQIACQWVWNLRLALGQQMQAAPVRDTLVSSGEGSPSCGRGCGKRSARVRSVAVGQSVRSGNGTARDLEPFPSKKMGWCVAQREPTSG